jgi:hypothetical protein
MKFREFLESQLNEEEVKELDGFKVGDVVTNTRNKEKVKILKLKKSVIKKGQRAVIGGKYQKLDKDVVIKSADIQYNDGENQQEDLEVLKK